MSESGSDSVVSKQHAARPPPTALGINDEKPKFPQYSVFSKRLESFDIWPEYLPVKKDDLVEAGLVYTGVGDSVRCYFCGGGLKNWEQDDVPMEEHAKWYPKCPHVLLVKGQAYIDKIGRGENPDEDSSSLNAATTKEQEYIESPAAQSCLQMDFPKDMVIMAIDIFKKKHGHCNFRGVDLVEILFSIEEESENNFLQNDATTKGQEHIESIAAQTCIAANFPKDMVMKAIDIFFETHGNCDFKIVDLLEILLSFEDEYYGINTCEKTVYARKDRQRQTKNASKFQRHGGHRKKSSGTLAWVISLIIKLMMTVLDDMLKTVTDIMSLLVKRYPQLFPDLTREPTEQDLVTLAEAIGKNFRFLGLALGLSDAKLDQISLDNPTTVMKTHSMLKEWREKNPMKATLSSLIQTMKSCRSVQIDWNQIGKVCMVS